MRDELEFLRSDDDDRFIALFELGRHFSWVES